MVLGREGHAGDCLSGCVWALALSLDGSTVNRRSELICGIPDGWTGKVAQARSPGTDRQSGRDEEESREMQIAERCRIGSRQLIYQSSIRHAGARGKVRSGSWRETEKERERGR